MNEGETVWHIRYDFLVQLLIVDFKYGQVDYSYGVSNHSFRMICELLSYEKEREMLVFLVIEKLYGVLVQKKGQRFDEGDVDVNELLVVKIEVEFN